MAAPERLALAREVASSVPDPELPMLTIAELGILRDVELVGEHVAVTITPTYLGCPALHEIATDTRRRLHAAGFADVEVQVRLAPPWTSDAITAEGGRKLAAAGIAPPRPVPAGPAAGASGRGVVPLVLVRRPPVPCPRCGSSDTTQLAAFGATPCTALQRCRGCGEPFEYVKDL